MRWICQEYYAPYDSVKADPYLKNKKYLATVSMGGDTGEGTTIGEPIISDADRRSNDEQFVKIWEIWDRIGGKVRWLCSGCSKWNREVPWPYADVRGFPFKPLAFTDGLNQFYPVSVVLPWLPLVEELSTLRAIRLKHIMKMPNKYLFPPGLLTEEQMNKIADIDVEFMEIQGDLTGNAKPYELQGLRPDANLYASEDKVKEDIYNISGLNRILMGESPGSRMPATTSAIMEQNSTIRFRHYSERLAEHITECGKTVFLIARQMLTFPQIVEITGEAGVELLEVPADALQGDYYFKVRLEDMSQYSKQQEIKEAFDRLQVLAPMPQIKLNALIRDFLQANGKYDVDMYVDPPTGPPLDPNWENMAMARGEPVRPNPQEDFRLHLEIHRVFMQSPDFQVLAQNMGIAALFSEHIQETNSLAEARAMQQQLGARRGGGGGAAAQSAQQRVSPPSAGFQQGAALAGSQPVGGQQGLQ
jgi:hypothetical protein